MMYYTLARKIYKGNATYTVITANKNMKADQVKAIVNEIRSSNDPNKEGIFRDKYPEFVRDCPKLFEATVNNEFPLTFLDMMIQQINNLDNSTTNKEEADGEIFKVLNEKYVDPLVAKPAASADADADAAPQ